MWIKCHQNRRYLNFPGGQKPPIKGGYMWPLMPHFQTQISYSNQKSCVKIWFGLVEPFKSYHLNFPWVGQKPPIGGVCKWPAMPIFRLGWAIPVKSHLCKFGSDWLSLSRVIMSTNIFLWGRHPLLGGGHIWTVRPIFELGWAIPVKSHVWKFGLDWSKSEAC